MEWTSTAPTGVDFSSAQEHTSQKATASVPEYGWTYYSWCIYQFVVVGKKIYVKAVVYANSTGRSGQHEIYGCAAAKLNNGSWQVSNRLSTTVYGSSEYTLGTLYTSFDASSAQTTVFYAGAYSSGTLSPADSVLFGFPTAHVFFNGLWADAELSAVVGGSMKNSEVKVYHNGAWRDPE